MRCCFLFLFLACAILFAGCSSEPRVRRTVEKKSGDGFQKLKDYSLLLSLVSPRREFYAGEENVTVTFSLKNTGLTPVTIQEWHMIEAANINLYYRPGSSEKSSDAPWKLSPTYDAASKRLHLRSPLTLNPGTNQALIVAPVAFLKELRDDSGKKQTYSIYAELNLKSVSVKSLPTDIYIK